MRLYFSFESDENLIDFGQLIIERIVVFNESAIPLRFILFGTDLLAELFRDIKQELGRKSSIGSREIVDNRL